MKTFELLSIKSNPPGPSRSSPALLAYGERLTQMTWSELIDRAVQACRKRKDLLTTSHRHLELRSLATAPHNEKHFFFQKNGIEAILDECRKLSLDYTERLVASADQICRHRFDLLGYQRIDYGEIDWHFDAVNRKRAPLKPWFKIRYLDFNEVGDAKVIWELNRLQHFVCLAKAYLLTEDTRYTLELTLQLQSWSRQNPYPYGINWASSLEVAIRALSLLWVENLLAGCTSLDAGFISTQQALLALSGKHISRYLSTYFSPNTHLLGEGVALFLLGVLHPEFSEAHNWRQLGWKIVLDASKRQVHRDGMHFEQSVYYHVYALDLFLHARILAERNAIAVPSEFDEVLERMLNVLAVFARQRQGIPLLGDGDGGRLFDPSRNRVHHMADPLATGAVLFGRADFKAASGGICEEALWLLGPGAMTRFSDLAPVAPGAKSVAFESSGIYVMTGPDEQIIFDAGPQGTGRAGHGHADALSLHLAMDGRSWLLDSGTFAYVDAGSERQDFRETKAHNTVEVDGHSQAEPTGPFAWGRLPSIEVATWHTSDSYDLLVASHDGYRQLPDPVMHCRWVFHMRSRFCLVRDVVQGAGNHRVDLRWHLAPGLSADVVGPTVMIRGSQARLLKIVSFGTGPWSCDVEQGWIAPTYGVKESAPIVHLSADTLLPAEFLTLLLFDPVVGNAGGLSAIGDVSTSSATGYAYAEGDAQHYFCFSEKRNPWRLGPCAGDARFTYLQLLDGQIERTVILDGSFFSYEGKTLLDFSEPVSWHEFDRKSVSPTALEMGYVS